MENNINYCQVGKIAAVCFQDNNYEDKVELQLGNNYEIKEENGKYYAVKKQFNYPNTYKECAKIMGVEIWNTLWGEDATEYEEKTEDLIDDLIRLKVCRDSYWKIAGDEMGLGKPWEPDWTDNISIKYCIEIDFNLIRKNIRNHKCYILAFPTKEMRDMFNKNFKDLIDNCKELL